MNMETCLSCQYPMHGVSATRELCCALPTIASLVAMLRQQHLSHSIYQRKLRTRGAPHSALPNASKMSNSCIMLLQNFHPQTNALPNTSRVKSPISLIIHRNYIHTPVPPNRRPFPTQAKGPNLPYHTYILLQNFHPNLPLSYIILTLETSTPHSPPINRSTNQPIRFQPCARREKEKKSGLRD